MDRLIRKVELEDVTSPRRAYYSISLIQLAEGYSIETCWGGAIGIKHHESYYRNNLISARHKFEEILALKTATRRKSKRHYQQIAEGQLSLNYMGGI